MDHVYPRLGCDLCPDIPASARAGPAFARLLSRNRDEAEIPDRGAIGLRVGIEHQDPLAPPRGGQRMGEPKDARADHGQIEDVFHALRNTMTRPVSPAWS
jgi:hypothetical protein